MTLPHHRLSRTRPVALAICLLGPVVASAWWPASSLAQGAKKAPAASASASAPASAAVASSASAQPLPAPPKPASAIASTVAKIAESLRPHASATLVVAAAPKTDTQAPRAAELVNRFSNLLAGALGPAARVGKSPSTIEAARAAASPAFRSFVIIELEIIAGELRVQADLYPVPKNIWDRTRNPTPGPSAHGFASARIDAEVRTYLAPVPLVALRAEKVGLDETEVVALGCEDIDADGALELVTVSRRNLTIGRVRAGKLQVLRRIGWSELSPISPFPWREPVAAIGFPAPSFIDVGLTDRARAVRLDPELHVISALDGMPMALPAGAACVRNPPGQLFDKLTRCRGDDPANQAKEPGFGFDAWASTRIVAPDGQVRDVWAARDGADSKLVVRDSTGRSINVARAGAQVALGDVDADGDPELITTRDVLDEKDDAVAVRTWQASGTLRDRVGLPVPSGVSAVTVCPADSPGLRSIVLATRNELWVLR